MAVNGSKFEPRPIFDTLETIKDIYKSGERPERSYIESANAANALKDYEHALLFLYSYRGSPDTFASYRREVERLLQWSWFVKGISITELKRADFEEFVEFCKHPPESWISTKTVARFILKQGLRVANPDWRPFVVKKGRSQTHITVKDFSLSSNALQSIFSILSSFYSYLVQEEYTELNPVASIRQKAKFISKRQGKSKIRRLSDLQWSYVVETAEIMAANKPSQHERTLFVIQSLYGMYLRVSELAITERDKTWIPQMGDFSQDYDGNWWFTTVGKGNKERDISVSNAMLNALKRYRTYLGLPSLPSPGETTPLIVKTRGKGAVSSTRQIRKIVDACFSASIARLKADGLPEEAENLKNATVHWLRHTGISDDVKHRPREHVRDDAGHSSSAITDKYIDIESRERHRSARDKPIKPDLG